MLEKDLIALGLFSFSVGQFSPAWSNSDVIFKNPSQVLYFSDLSNRIAMVYLFLIPLLFQLILWSNYFLLLFID